MDLLTNSVLQLQVCCSKKRLFLSWEIRDFGHL